MESLSILNVFCTTSECATTSTSKFIKIPNFIIFYFFFWTFFSGFLKFRRGVLRDEFLVIFGIEHGHNSSIPEGGALTRLILVCSLKSVRIVQNPEIILWCMWRRSSSGWVPMILKVLPFSLTSGLHFSYISYCCIFNISRSRINFLKKSISKTTFVWMHHIYDLRTLRYLSNQLISCADSKERS